MAQLVVRNLPDSVKERLKLRARRHGRSLEAEVRSVLEAAASAPLETFGPPPGEGLGSWLAREMSKYKVSRKDWEEFERSLRESRRSWSTRPVEFDP